jgi:acetyl esterase
MTSVYYPGYPQGTLHPDSEAILRQIAEGNFKPLCEMTPEEARKAFLLSAWLGEPRGEVAIRAAATGPVPIRVYTPPGEAPFPVLLYFHGGGFVLGNLAEFEPFCTHLAAGARCIVVSVDYRLAPEAPFPAAVDDAWEALEWVASNATSFGGDASRLAVAGDSAGGNLAAVLSLIARDRGGPELSHQTLICPWLDLSEEATRAESFHLFGDGLWLSAESLSWYRGLYLRDLGEAHDPRVSPLLAPDVSALPRALVILAEFDVLADQGRAYARRLREAGVPVTETRTPGTLHDFVTLPGLFSPAWGAIGEITASVRAAFAR